MSVEIRDEPIDKFSRGAVVYEQDGLNVTANAVLMTFAMHANERGYSWPGVERIASTWSMDRETVRRQIEALLVRRKIYGIKKRCGATGQVKVENHPGKRSQKPLLWKQWKRRQSAG